MLQFALNRMTAPNLPLEDFFDVVGGLGCVGDELRNDLATGLFYAGGAENAAQGIVPIPQVTGTIPEIELCAADYRTEISRYHRPKSKAFEVKTFHRNRMSGTGLMR